MLKPALFRGAAATLLVSAVVGLAACRDEGPVELERGVPSAVLWAGEISGVLNAADPKCQFVTADWSWRGVCDSYSVSLPSSGLFEVTAIRYSEAGLRVFLTDEERGTLIEEECFCDMGGETLRAPLLAGRRYRLEFAYTENLGEYLGMDIPLITYDVGTRLLTPTGVDRATLRVILFADSARTQRMREGLIEVTQGPFFNRHSGFNNDSRTHEIDGLPWGYVTVRASADGFRPQVVVLPVGTHPPQEVVLTRAVPLPGTANSLSGMLWATTSRAYGDAKVEILDGPQAGAFTLSDHEEGSYHLPGLSAGVIRVRASRPGIVPLTKTVTVAGQTTLDFRW